MCKTFRRGKKVDEMHNFMYGSRVIENERTVSLETHITRAGNTIRSVVKFFAMLVVVLLFNYWLKNFNQRFEFSFNGIRVLQESLYLFFNESALSAMSVVYQHMFCAVMAILGCAAVFTLILSLRRSISALAVRVHSRRVQNGPVQNSQNWFGVISFRQKVCFLS